MGTVTSLGVEEYLRTSYSPDCDFVEGEVRERNVGKRKHSYAQSEISSWFRMRPEALNLQGLTEQRMQLGPRRVRIPDVAVCEIPIPDEEVLTSPPYLCVEVMSPDDTFSAVQDKLDDYLEFGVRNVWVVDPWAHRGWSITAGGWAAANNGVMRTADRRVAMALADVLLP